MGKERQSWVAWSSGARRSRGGAEEVVISLFMILTSSHADSLSGENHPAILSRAEFEALLRFITYYTVVKNELTISVPLLCLLSLASHHTRSHGVSHCLTKKSLLVDSVQWENQLKSQPIPVRSFEVSGIGRLQSLTYHKITFLVTRVCY